MSNYSYNGSLLKSKKKKKKERKGKKEKKETPSKVL